MDLLIKIAWRNVWRHKGKSLVVGSILFLGAFLMTVGTGIVSGMNKGLQRSIVQSFTGDIVLVPEKQKSDNVLLDMMGASVEVLTDYDSLKQFLAGSELVDSWLPIGKNTAMVLNDAGGSFDGVFLIGVDMKQYSDFFNDNLEVIQGSMLQEDEHGILLATGAQQLLTTSMGIFFMPESTQVDTSIMPEEAKKMGDNLLTRDYMIFMGLTDDNTSTDIRLPIRGLVKYKSLNSILGIYAIIDIESYRQCMGYISAGSQSAPVSEKARELLEFDESNLEALFNDQQLMVEDELIRSEPLTPAPPTPDTALGKLDIDAGSYNLVLVRLRDGVGLKQGLETLESQLDSAGLSARPVSWHKSIGPVGSMAVLIKSSLFVFVMLLFFVAVVIIINTLIMAALERTNEIGMMRAIGAQRNFIGRMFIAETSVLSAFFGGIGIVVGWIAIAILAALNIQTSNDMVQLLYGGDTFNPFLTVTDFLLVVVQLILVVILAVIYPVLVARKITPLDAITRE